MNDIIKEYFAEKEEEAKAERQEFLINLGLYEKEYVDKADSEHPYIESCPDGILRYYRRKVCDVSEEEFNRILSYEAKYKDKTKTKTKTNAVSNLFIVVAWLIFIGGFILGIWLGNETRVMWTFNWESAIACWFVSFFAGMTYLGFGEVIKLLHKISDKE